VSKRKFSGSLRREFGPTTRAGDQHLESLLDHQRGLLLNDQGNAVFDRIGRTQQHDPGRLAIARPPPRPEAPRRRREFVDPYDREVRTVVGIAAKEVGELRACVARLALLDDDLFSRVVEPARFRFQVIEQRLGYVDVARSALDATHA
jgi:hypothetical protein